MGEILHIMGPLNHHNALRKGKGFFYDCGLHSVILPHGLFKALQQTTKEIGKQMK